MPILCVHLQAKGGEQTSPAKDGIGRKGVPVCVLCVSARALFRLIPGAPPGGRLAGL